MSFPKSEENPAADGHREDDNPANVLCDDVLVNNISQASADAVSPTAKGGGLTKGVGLTGSADLDNDGDAADAGDRGGDAPEAARNTVNAMLNVLIPYGGMLSTGFNLASTSVGAGILGLPSAFNSAGMIMAIFYLVFITVETVYSMRLLAQVSDMTGLRSFEEMGIYLLHPKLHIFIALIRVLHTYGGMVAYVVTIGDLLQPILEAISGTPPFLLTPVGRKLLQSAFWLLFMCPLAFTRKFNSLRYISAIGLLFIVYFVVVVIVHSAGNGMKADPPVATKLFNTGNTALSAATVISFSFMTQIASVELYIESRNRSVARFTLCATISMALCGLLFFLVGIFGYLDFGTDVRGSILLHYNPIEQPQVFVAYIGIFIKVCASFGLVSSACRAALFPLFGWNPATIPLWKHVIGAGGVALVAFLLGLFIPSINVVLALTGGLAGGFVGFILPAIYIMYAGKWTLRSVGIVNYVCVYCILIAGCFCVVSGTASAIYGLATD